MQAPPTSNGICTWTDRFGVVTSALCVIHCLFTPVFVSYTAVAAHFLPADESVHRTLAVLVTCFGVFAVFAGFRRHRRRRVLALVITGLLLITAAAWFGDKFPSHICEVAVTFFGSSLIIAAHRLNHTFCQACQCTSRPSKSSEPEGVALGE